MRIVIVACVRFWTPSTILGLSVQGVEASVILRARGFLVAH